MAEAARFDIARATALAGMPHGFFGHSGGVYQFGYGGEGEEAAIHASRAAAAEAILPGGTFVAPHQVHPFTSSNLRARALDRALEHGEWEWCPRQRSPHELPAQGGGNFLPFT